MENESLDIYWTSRLRRLQQQTASPKVSGAPWSRTFSKGTLFHRTAETEIPPLSMTMQNATWISAEKAGGIEYFPAVGCGAGKLSLSAGNIPGVIGKRTLYISTCYMLKSTPSEHYHVCRISPLCFYIFPSPSDPYRIVRTMYNIVH